MSRQAFALTRSPPLFRLHPIKPWTRTLTVERAEEGVESGHVRIADTEN